MNGRFLRSSGFPMDLERHKEQERRRLDSLLRDQGVTVVERRERLRKLL
ncbi:MAG: hypothetical protein IPJ55_10820 [Chloracidobacterium sp.]|nr:hypothetical protein [Chloracidobacterium sp.]